MITLVAFDLDGTLAPSKQPLGSDMARLLGDLAKHAKVAVISGGSFKQFNKQFIPVWETVSVQENLSNSNLILLPVNGSQCYERDAETDGWKIVDEDTFSPELKSKVTEELNVLIMSGEYGIPPRSETFGEYIEDRDTQITFSALGQEAPLEKKQIWDPDQKKRLRMKEELEKHLDGQVEISIAGTTSIDFLPKGTNKARGLKRLLDRLGMDIKDAAFVGDAVFPGGNDYSPLEAGIKTIKVAGPEETAEVIRKFIKTPGGIM